MIETIQWLGHGSFRIEGPPLIYINPWRVARAAFHADVILIGHDHYEHFSLADIEKLRGPTTRVITNEKTGSQIDGAQVLRPWQSITIERARVTAVPAYSPDDLRHKEEDGGLGFVISVNFFDIYYAGDTMTIPEMARLQPDIVILPIDGAGTLTVEEAVAVVNQMRPRYVLPSNYGADSVGATLQDARAFQELVGQRAEVILPPLSR